jgi:hypothetical protein
VGSPGNGAAGGGGGGAAGTPKTFAAKSDFLSQFLGKRRQPQTVQPPPIETSSDNYLKEFTESFQSQSGGSSSSKRQRLEGEAIDEGVGGMGDSADGGVDVSDDDEDDDHYEGVLDRGIPPRTHTDSPQNGTDTSNIDDTNALSIIAASPSRNGEDVNNSVADVDSSVEDKIRCTNLPYKVH